jgi:glutamate--cysteine ligase catalytic subunit
MPYIKYLFHVRQLALTAASPFYRGYITDVDCRWNVISCSVDCRTEEERGLKPLKENKFIISKSRYDSIDSYLSDQGDRYNDVPLIYDENIYKQLLDNGIDRLLSQHIAHLFIRDTISLFSEKVHQNDLEDTDHFEVNILLLFYITHVINILININIYY